MKTQWFNTWLGILILVCISGHFSGCSIVAPPLEGKYTTSINATEGTMGLALSGGGLRSGATSTGVLQELQRTRRLADFAYIATVSGGGYPVYGVLTELATTDENLGKLLNEDGDFIKHLDRHSRMVASGRIAADLVLAPIWWAFSFARVQTGLMESSQTYPYGHIIHKSFSRRGDWAQIGKPVKLSALSGEKFAGFPYPLIITSAYDGRSAPLDRRSHSPNMLVFSPRWIGSDALGYYATKENKINLIDAIALSGAAPDVPLPFTPPNQTEGQQVENRVKYSLRDVLKKLRFAFGGVVKFRGKNTFITDGGFVDNTGVLALLQRRCSEIVVLDASDDVRATFESFTKLRERAALEGWKLGKISSVSSTSSTDAISGWNLPSHIWFMNGEKGTSRVRIWIMKLGINRLNFSEGHYPKSVSTFLQENWAGQEPRVTGKSIFSLRSSFPLESTFRQDFFQDEYIAYRHLGKFLVQEWENAFEKVEISDSSRR
jgi:hypothetical protein